MFCKYCGSEMEEGKHTCPSCGKNNQSGDALKIVLASVAGALVIAILGTIVAIGAGVQFPGTGTTPTNPNLSATNPPATIPTDGNPDDETCKGSYTVTDAVLLDSFDTVVATMGEETLTNRQLQVYYWLQVMNFLRNYGSYASYFGLDYTKPLDTQLTGNVTWQQYFLGNALIAWQSETLLYNLAKEANYEMPASYKEYLDGLEDTLKEDAEAEGYASVDEMLEDSMGAGATFEAYDYYLQRYYLGNLYYQELRKNMELDVESLKAEYDAQKETLVSKYSWTSGETGTLVSVRHCLVQPVSATGASTYTDEEWEACRVKAQQLYDQWLAGDKSEESFHQLAAEHSEDGNKEDGGIYPEVYPKQMVTEFNDWCFDETRVHGDHALIKTTYGYHIMFFVEAYEDYHPVVKDAVRDDKIQEWMTQFLKDNAIDVTYSDIVLGYVDLT